MKQYLCSHLVTLRFEGRETTANLEKIWAEGASVNSEERVAEGATVVILTSGCELAGFVQSCETDPAGNFLEIVLDEDWSLEKFVPDHLTDPDKLAARQAPQPGIH
jgi:hypothetical protein